MSATDVIAATGRIERLSVDLDIGPGVAGAGDADALALRVRRELTPAVEEAMAAFADRALRLETLEVDLGSHVGPIDWPALRRALVEALTAALRARLPDAGAALTPPPASRRGADGGYRTAAARDAPAPPANDGAGEAAPDRNPALAGAGQAGRPPPLPERTAATARLSATLAAAEAMVGGQAAGATALGDAGVALSAAALRARLLTLADALSARGRDRARTDGAPPPETPPMTPDAQKALTALLRIASGADGHDAAAGAARARLARWRAAAATARDTLAVLRAALAEEIAAQTAAADEPVLRPTHGPDANSGLEGPRGSAPAALRRNGPTGAAGARRAEPERPSDGDARPWAARGSRDAAPTAAEKTGDPPPARPASPADLRPGPESTGVESSGPPAAVAAASGSGAQKRPKTQPGVDARPEPSPPTMPTASSSPLDGGAPLRAATPGTVGDEAARPFAAPGEPDRGGASGDARPGLPAAPPRDDDVAPPEYAGSGDAGPGPMGRGADREGAADFAAPAAPGEPDHGAASGDARPGPSAAPPRDADVGQTGDAWAGDAGHGPMGDGARRGGAADRSAPGAEDGASRVGVGRRGARPDSAPPHRDAASPARVLRQASGGRPAAAATAAGPAGAVETPAAVAALRDAAAPDAADRSLSWVADALARASTTGAGDVSPSRDAAAPAGRVGPAKRPHAPLPDSIGPGPVGDAFAGRAAATDAGAAALDVARAAGDAIAGLLLERLSGPHADGAPRRDADASPSPPPEDALGGPPGSTLKPDAIDRAVRRRAARWLRRARRLGPDALTAARLTIAGEAAATAAIATLPPTALTRITHRLTAIGAPGADPAAPEPVTDPPGRNATAAALVRARRALARAALDPETVLAAWRRSPTALARFAAAQSRRRNAALARLARRRAADAGGASALPPEAAGGTGVPLADAELAAAAKPTRPEPEIALPPLLAQAARRAAAASDDPAAFMRLTHAAVAAGALVDLEAIATAVAQRRDATSAQAGAEDAAAATPDGANEAATRQDAAPDAPPATPDGETRPAGTGRATPPPDAGSPSGADAPRTTAPPAALPRARDRYNKQDESTDAAAPTRRDGGAASAQAGGFVSDAAPSGGSENAAARQDDAARASPATPDAAPRPAGTGDVAPTGDAGSPSGPNASRSTPPRDAVAEAWDATTEAQLGAAPAALLDSGARGAVTEAMLVAAATARRGALAAALAHGWLGAPRSRRLMALLGEAGLVRLAAALSPGLDRGALQALDAFWRAAGDADATPGAVGARDGSGAADVGASPDAARPGGGDAAFWRVAILVADGGAATASPTAQLAAAARALGGDATRAAALRTRARARLARSPQAPGAAAALAALETLDAPTAPAAPRNAMAEESAAARRRTETAGLVLLAPFMPRLFRTLGLLDGDAFRAPDAGWRAMDALACAAYGSAPPDAAALSPLERLLCGVPATEPPRRFEPLNAEDAAVVEAMLRAALAAWPRIGRTSVAGLREAFLRREGLLRAEPEQDRLTVADAPYDMLLDSVPWPFRIVRHRWMARPLRVVWRDRDD